MNSDIISKKYFSSLKSNKTFPLLLMSTYISTVKNRKCFYVVASRKLPKFYDINYRNSLV